MIDFSKLLTPEQKANIAKRKEEEAKRTVGTITAYDENGRQFEKTVMLSKDLKNIDFGWPIQYALTDVLNWLARTHKNLCIDAGGLNHSGSPTYLNYEELKELLEKAKTLAETLKAEKEML